MADTKRGGRAGWLLAGLALAVVLSAAAGLCLGSQPYTLPQLVQALRAQDPQDTAVGDGGLGLPGYTVILEV